MEKLLHERLREWAKDNCYAPVPIIALKDECNEAAIDAFTMIADEIEREYIPRPRYEDGEVLKNGGEIECYGRAETVVSYLVSSNCPVPFATLHLKCGASYNVSLDKPLKRPQPKVYDADGEKINVGDTVWSVQNGKQAVVSATGQFETEYSKGNVMLEGVSECYKGMLFTHKEPVLDADGVPIKVEDTVWHIKGDGTWPYRVVDIKEGTVACITPKCPGLTAWQDPKDLTHKEPDSVKKICDDMEAWLEYPPMEAEGIAIGKWRDRLSALIERGA